MHYPAKYIVSETHHFVYFVVPKVACSSIKTALVPLFDLDTSGYEGASWDENAPYDVHQLFDKSGYQINKRQLQRRLQSGRYLDYFKFAFVRNPFDRLLSCWRQKLSTADSQGFNRYDYDGVTVWPGMQFAEFVEAVCAISEEEANPHWRSQHITLCSDDGMLIPDFVGRFENLEESFTKVAREIALPDSLRNLPRLLSSNQSDKLHYRDFFDHQRRQLTEIHYANDLEIFGYSF